MKGIMRKISYLFMLVAIFMLISMRVMPHHHCECSSSAAAPVHFALGDCDKCEHHGCGEDEEHTGKLCYDASLFYYRLADENTFAVKKCFFPLQFIALLNISVVTDASAVHLQWPDSEDFTPPDRAVSSLALRGPPVA